jgi:tetratricopeptide (TPR) repeat protein
MRRKAGSSSSKKNKSKRDNGSEKKKDNLTVAQLVGSAENAMASLDVEQAAQIYSEAASKLRVQLASNNPSPKQAELMLHILEKMGECKVSIGDQEGARQDFHQALTLLEQQSSDTNSMAYHETRSNLYLYSGQLCMEKEALEAYQKGVQSLEACLAFSKSGETMEESNDDTGRVLRQKISGAYCTIAELYLTDLCYEDNAEAECESYLEKALQIKDADGEPLVDALQTMSSLRLSQKTRQLEAVPYLLRAYDKMKVGSEALAALVGLGEGTNSEDEMAAEKEEEAMELKEVDAANNLPEFEFRCQTAKLLLECAELLKESPPPPSGPSQEDQCLSAAVSVLGSLLAQNDEVVEIWFLTGCAFASKRPPLVDPAKFYLDRTMEMLQDIKKALEQEVKFADQEDLADLKEELEENGVQIEDVAAKLAELGVSEAGGQSMEE